MSVNTLSLLFSFPISIFPYIFLITFDRTLSTVLKTSGDRYFCIHLDFSRKFFNDLPSNILFIIGF